jgi:hypothetical protein
MGRGTARTEVRGRPGPATSIALRALSTELADPCAAATDPSPEPGSPEPFGAVVDAVVAARRLAGWSLWVELAAIARLLTAWRQAPPILDERLGPDPCAEADPGLAARLHRVIRDLELDPVADPRPWGSPPLDTADLADEFVISEVVAATGLSFTRARQRIDAATALFLTDRLPRTAALLQAGLLDETKLRTLLSGTAELGEATCRVVEARVIPDADLDIADPLDVHAEPDRPGAALPVVTR